MGAPGYVWLFVQHPDERFHFVVLPPPATSHLLPPWRSVSLLGVFLPSSLSPNNYKPSFCPHGPHYNSHLFLQLLDIIMFFYSFRFAGW